MSKQKVSLTRDIALPIWPAPCMSLHAYIPMTPPPVPPTFALHIEAPTNMAWIPGFGQHKFTTSVFHGGSAISLEGHDCGLLIPHACIVPVAPINLLTALHIMFSSRKMMFSASTVQMNGAATGISDLFALPPTPMLVCEQPMSLPLGFPLTNAGNTVCVGATAGDLVSGFVGIAISMASDAILSFWFPKGTPASTLAGEITKQVLGKLIGGFGKSVVKAAAAMAAGLVKIALTGQGAVDIKVGSPYGQVKVGAEYKNGKLKFKSSANAGPIELKGEVDLAGKQKASVGVNTGNGQGPKIEREDKTAFKRPSPKHDAASAVVGGEEPL